MAVEKPYMFSSISSYKKVYYLNNKWTKQVYKGNLNKKYVSSQANKDFLYKHIEVIMGDFIYKTKKNNLKTFNLEHVPKKGASRRLYKKLGEGIR